MSINRQTATQAIAHFVALVHARMKADPAAERRAKGELAQLGIDVRWSEGADQQAQDREARR